VWHQTSWPTVNETARRLGVPVDVLRPALHAQGIDVGPEDRYPFEVLRDAAVRAGVRRERLFPA
jgi:hypothetical protein